MVALKRRTVIHEQLPRSTWLIALLHAELRRDVKASITEEPLLTVHAESKSS
jgi:DNA-directed RNA polymerase specialized sigma54-like protein